MNSRIYSQEVFEREIERLKLGHYYCPKCFENSLTTTVGFFTLFLNYHCEKCKQTFPKYQALSKEKVREIKINRILK